MNIRYSGKNLKLTGGMREHLDEKLGKLEKYAPRLVDTHVFLKKEKYLFCAEITLKAKNLRACGEGKSKENIFTAMDEAYSRIEKQLKKYREKVKDHHIHGKPLRKSETTEVVLEESEIVGSWNQGGNKRK